MLSRLSIRDIVLIDRLDIDFADGLAVLTGETGAGKSILLDAFALALGGRGDQTLVRQGLEQGQVTAVFDVPRNHPARALLAANDIPAEDELILRRVQLADGRTRAFVNDQPVSVQVLEQLGRRWSRSTASTTSAHWSMPRRIAGFSMRSAGLRARRPESKRCGRRGGKRKPRPTRIAPRSSAPSARATGCATRSRS